MAGVACVAITLTSLGEPLAAVSVSVPVHRFPPRRRAALIETLQLSRAEPDGAWPSRLAPG